MLPNQTKPYQPIPKYAHINQEPNVGTSTAAIRYAAPLNVILAVKPLKNILSENLQPVFLRLLLSFYNGEYVIVPDKV